MTPSVAWLIVGLIALIVEALSLNLVFVFVAIAAIVAGAAAVLGVPFLGQIGAFVIAGLALPVVLRPRLLALMGGRGVISRTDALFGETGQVTEAIDSVRGTGRIIVNGNDWAARSTDPIAIGTLVMVEGADGIVLLVSTINPPELLQA